jgi:hypothetical protein
MGIAFGAVASPYGGYGYAPFAYPPRVYYPYPNSSYNPYSFGPAGCAAGFYWNGAECWPYWTVWAACGNCGGREGDEADNTRLDDCRNDRERGKSERGNKSTMLKVGYANQMLWRLRWKRHLLFFSGMVKLEIKDTEDN